eukprot:sb/3465812/
MSTPATSPDATMSDHIIMVPSSLSSSPLWDSLLGIALICCAVLGIPGNFLASRYFISRHRRNIGSILYITISYTDLCTSFSHLPIVFCLFNNRRPVFFGRQGLCVFWALFFKYLQRFSIFLVMILSVTRCLAITIPFIKLNRLALLVSIGFYAALLITVDLFKLRPDSYKFVSIGPFCTDSPLQQESEDLPGNYTSWVTITKTLTTLELGVPSVITFFSFAITIAKLSQNCNSFIQKQRNKRASVTAAIFTVVFLLCNLPFFTLMVLNTVTRAVGYKYPEPFFTSPFMVEYSFLVAKIVLTVLNATINPIVYYHRIRDFRRWILEVAATHAPLETGDDEEEDEEREERCGRGPDWIHLQVLKPETSPSSVV